jgi:hypothetical protein
LTIAADGNGHGNFNAISGAISLTSAIDADEIAVSVSIANGSTQTVSSVTSDKGVAFTKRTAKVNGTAINVETWYGGWGSHGTINITVTLSASAKFVVNAYAISGLPAQSAIFDANAACPKDISGTGTAVTTGTVGATTSTADFGFCAVGIVGNASQSLTMGNVYGTAATASVKDNTGTTSADVYGGLEYLVLSAAKTNLAGTWTAGSSQAYVVILDAIVGYSSTEVTSASGAGAATETFIANSVTAATGAGAATETFLANSVTPATGSGTASAADIASSVAAATGAGQSAAASLASSIAAASAGGQSVATATSSSPQSTTASASGSSLATVSGTTGIAAASAAGASVASAVMTNPGAPTVPGLTNDDDETMASEVQINPWWARLEPQSVTWTRIASIELVGMRKVMGFDRAKLKGSRSITSQERSIGVADRTFRSSAVIMASKTLTISSRITLPAERRITSSSIATLETKKKYNDLLDLLIAGGVFDE